MLQSSDFTWDEYYWVTDLALRGWPGSGTTRVTFAPDGRGDGPLLDSELELLRWFERNETEVCRVVLDALVSGYPRAREFYATIADHPDELPVTLTYEDIPSYFQLTSVTVHQLNVGEFPYIGFEIDTAFEPEHGVGVLMHGTRVVDIGGADTALYLWIAERDARSNRAD